MADLSSKQITEIKGNRKKETDLPGLYRSEQVTTSPISRVFEANLILLDDSTKQEGLEWIDTVLGYVEQSEERLDLEREFLNNRKSDNENKVSSLNSVFGGFNKFRERLIDVPYQPSELQQFFTDVNVVLGPLDRTRSVEDHLDSLLRVIESRDFPNEGVADSGN